MLQVLASPASASLAANPLETLALGKGLPVAILGKNVPAFYCIFSKAYEEIVNLLEDIALNAIADARAGQPVIRVDFDLL